MKYLSVCSGIEAATVAWNDLGWAPVGFSEIEPFPSAVLAHHYPEVPNLGDMTKYREWEYERGSIDLLVGGTPCQSFSVAGLRRGLSDPRGNLALVYLGIADHFRPRWLLWENVPGVLSSNGGRDFGAFLGALSELGYGWAYRVIDAQYLGVPQRRRRVFVVGYLGDWRPAAAVLFERESLRRDTPPSRKTGEKTSGCIRRGANQRHNKEIKIITAEHQPIGIDEECNATVDGFGTLMRGGQGGTRQAVCVHVEYYENHGQDSRITGPHETAETVAAKYGTGGNNTPIIMAHGQANAEIREDGQATTLTCNHEAPIMAFPERMSSTQRATTENLSPSIMSRNPTAVSYGIPGNWIGRKPENGGNATTPMEDVAPCLTKTDIHGVSYGLVARRITPVECERLQGFPDNYTRIPWRGKPADKCPDAPRYKAIGNSMAVPAMRRIGMMIQAVDKILKARIAA